MRDSPTSPPGRGWFRLPLFVRIAIGLVVGVLVGFALRPLWHGPTTAAWLQKFAAFCDGLSTIVVTRLLTALAIPLIFLAVVRSIITTDIKGTAAARLFYLLILNTVVAILVGLTVANVVRPGTHAHLPQDPRGKHVDADPVADLIAKLPDSLLRPLVENNAIGVVVLSLTFGIAARRLAPEKRGLAVLGLSVGFDLVVTVLHWVLELVPLAVATRVASLLITQGLDPFKALAWFVGAVLLALLLQSGYYLLRVAWRSWVTPAALLRGTGDALVMSLSTGSSVATMPLTYECMANRIGLRPESASLGVLVGGNFNHDGTALYEAMSALFVAQAIGVRLSLWHQLLVVVTSMVAAFGAAGIPEAGLVTMTLVFNAVGLPVAQVAMLLPVDWFLDRCRTMINVMGDTSIACLLDGTQQQHAAATAGEPSADHQTPVQAEDRLTGVATSAATDAR